MKNIRYYFISATVGFFILLFCYAAISKAIDFENFQVQIGQSPLLSAYANTVSYGVIAIEIFTVILLCFKKLRTAGLYCSTALMSAFTVYIYLILNYSDFVPCSCGGILEKLGWTEHLVFNIFCVILGAAAVFSTDYDTGQRAKSTLGMLTIFNSTACVIVVFLFITSEQIIKKDNNFTRRFLMHPVVEHQIKVLDNDNYYFAGADDKNVYLGNRKFPQKILTVDSAMKNQTYMEIRLDITEFPYRKIETQVRYPFYYIYDGTVPVIKKGMLGNPDPRTISDKDAYFSQLGIVSNTNFILRTQSSKTGQLLIASLQTRQKNTIRIHANFLEKQTDGVFDSDGRLITDAGSPEIIYTYAYRNQFIVADSNAQIKHRLNTIDTVTRAHIKSVQVNNGIFKMNRPPLRVNGLSRVHRRLLFNHSQLKGRYESRKSWNTSRVIDIYRTDQKLYVGSLHLPDKNKIPVTDFIVTDHHLYAIAGNQLIQYILTRPVLKHYQ
ncbi:MauE/DoxX family redox-associated membrane protein [Chryseobacterium caseinilyticum]|uniref:Tellurium resistance protein TerC n=1 Tax=Chryseobacterium caseinilyticum TaxID=2771428 RepID=A0ABR8ZH84_9FLAO|nr:MauE/DoxX family redox-associated membrane protein [Chryseobacterium caseinilyticum]MBD8084645.1 tellurium resistance protein TerC [Chryseobacterium caseinilyticum]